MLDLPTFHFMFLIYMKFISKILKTNPCISRAIGSGARPGQNRRFSRGWAPEPSVLAPALARTDGHGDARVRISINFFNDFDVFCYDFDILGSDFDILGILGI